MRFLVFALFFILNSSELHRIKRKLDIGSLTTELLNTVSENTESIDDCKNVIQLLRKQLKVSQQTQYLIEGINNEERFLIPDSLIQQSDTLKDMFFATASGNAFVSLVRHSVATAGTIERRFTKNSNQIKLDLNNTPITHEAVLFLHKLCCTEEQKIDLNYTQLDTLKFFISVLKAADFLNMNEKLKLVNPPNKSEILSISKLFKLKDSEKKEIFDHSEIKLFKNFLSDKLKNRLKLHLKFEFNSYKLNSSEYLTDIQKISESKLLCSDENISILDLKTGTLRTIFKKPNFSYTNLNLINNRIIVCTKIHGKRFSYEAKEGAILVFDDLNSESPNLVKEKRLPRPYFVHQEKNKIVLIGENCITIVDIDSLKINQMKIKLEYPPYYNYSTILPLENNTYLIYKSNKGLFRVSIDIEKGRILQEETICNAIELQNYGGQIYKIDNNNFILFSLSDYRSFTLESKIFKTIDSNLLPRKLFLSHIIKSSNDSIYFIDRCNGIFRMKCCYENNVLSFKQKFDSYLKLENASLDQKNGILYNHNYKDRTITEIKFK